MSEEEQLSPEEKLLKVIQEGGGESEPPAPVPVAEEEPVTIEAVVAPEAEPAIKLEAVEAVAQPVAEPVAASAPAPVEPAAMKIPPKTRPKLKLAQPKAAHSGGRAGTKGSKAPSKASVSANPLRQATSGKMASKPVAVAEEPGKKKAAATGGMINAGPLARVGKKTGRKKAGVTLVNRALAAAALIFVGLTGWEVWANIQEGRKAVGLPSSMEPRPAGQLQAVPAEALGQGLVALDNVLKNFERRPILTTPPKRGSGTGTTREVIREVRKSNWEIYARGNLKLKGLSTLNDGEGTMEAILEDKKVGKLFFLKKGDEILLDKKKVTVEAVEKDQLILSDGVKRIGLK